MTSRFAKLEPYIRTARERGGHFRFDNPPFMRLCGEIISGRNGRGIISLAHYYEMNGDLVPDPEMEIEFDSEARTVKPRTFSTQASYTLSEEGPSAVSSMTEFLDVWLGNLQAQGFAKMAGGPEPEPET